LQFLKIIILNKIFQKVVRLQLFINYCIIYFKKKLMKKTILTVLTALAILYGCKNNVDVEQKYDDLKKIPYTTMSSEQKLEFETGAVEKLKTDPDFIAFNKLINEQGTSIFNANKNLRSNGIKQPSKNNNLSALENTKAQGIENPKTYLENKTKLIVKMLFIAKKYPELAKLDRETRKKIFKQANKKN
jgi:hypothetical protein